MINQLVQKLFGTKHERELKKMQPLVAQIGTLEKRFEKLSDDELRGHTASFKERIAKGEALDQLLPEAFATVRVAGVRALGVGSAPSPPAVGASRPAGHRQHWPQHAGGLPAAALTANAMLSPQPAVGVSASPR